MALTRMLSVAEWHHFAYMIISVALLGFAASGTAVAILDRALEGRRETAFRAGALLLVVAFPGSGAAAAAIPFETFELLVRPVQFAWLLLLYLVLAVPFFLVSWCVALGFQLRPERVGRVYFADLLGSGLGATAVVGLLFLFPPGRIPLLLALPAAGACAATLSRRTAGRWAAGLAAAGAAAWLVAAPRVPVSQYKGLAYALDLPDARVVAERWSPVSVLTAVSSDLLRETPGQISGYPMRELGPLPPQVGLYFDGDALSPVHRFDGELEPFAFLDYVTPALPYRLVERPRVLVVGSGGGTEVLNALLHGAVHVTALELDPSVLPLLRGPLAGFAGGLYDRPDVTAVTAEARGWLAGRPEARFDLIQLSLLDSFTASAAGVRALSESYLYTVEAIGLLLARLNPDGALAVTRWLRTPPRDAVKMLATLAEAAERAGIERPGDHLAFVRSWNTGTMVLSRSPIGPARAEAVRRWAAERGFDLAWLPDLRPEETNRHTVLEEPVYWEAARRIVGGSPADRELFYERYPFHVRPATDDRPHFFRFFRWDALGRVLEALGSQWRNAVEWGYVVLAATVLQAAAAAVLVVLLPLAVVGARRRVTRREAPPGEARTGLGRVILYFGALGLAYLFLEIAFIQKLMLFLAHPVYAVAVVLAAFLVFSGAGSAAADRLAAADPTGTPPRPAGAGRSLLRPWAAGPRRRVLAAAIVIAALAGLYVVGLPPLFAAWAGWSVPAKVGVALALLAPLAFLMGVPFPTGLQVVARRDRRTIAWAWAVNGAASVVAAPLATLAAVHLGFAAVVGLGAALYGLAAATAPSPREPGTGAPELRAPGRPSGSPPPAGPPATPPGPRRP